MAYPTSPVRYEVIAVRYATRPTSRHESYYRHSIYNEPDAPMRMDYYFWLLRDSHQTILIDTGFSPQAGRRRGRTMLIEPVEALTQLGIRPRDVSRIIVTHLHYDHIGNLAAFPDCPLSVPRAELDFWTSADAARAQFTDIIERAEINYVAEAWHAGRVQLIEDTQEVMPGVTARIVGGHSPGQQITLVPSELGLIVLASDAIHFYEELERDWPFEVFVDLASMYRAYDLLRDLQTQAGGVVVAGHDPIVMDRFPGLSGSTDGLAARVA
jgi:glyoxylase-like metal-dependent hydrolase (beta-lactamase superfamily II)